MSNVTSKQVNEAITAVRRPLRKVNEAITGLQTGHYSGENPLADAYAAAEEAQHAAFDLKQLIADIAGIA